MGFGGKVVATPAPFAAKLAPWNEKTTLPNDYWQPARTFLRLKTLAALALAGPFWTVTN